MKPDEQWDNSGAVEIIARALCYFDGLMPDHSCHGIAQWERYRAQAQTVLNALSGIKPSAATTEGL